MQHRHGLRMALESSAIALLATVYMGDAAQFTMVAGALPTLYANAHYSRAHESEADEFALGFMQTIGIPKYHFAVMLKRFQEHLGDHEMGYLSSHPPTKERVARFE